MAVNPDIVHERLVLMREMLEALDTIGPVTLDRLQSDITVRLATPSARTARNAIAADPRIHLAGYGPSASTIGANRAGRAAVREIREPLAH